MRKRVYLDANAGSPLLGRVRDAFIASLEAAANASSVHTEGRKARQLVENARAEIGAAVGARAESVIFTSGATEAAAFALTPHIQSGRDTVEAGHLYVGATEHPCVLAGGRFASSSVTRLPVRPTGLIDLAALEDALAGHDDSSGPPYLALMLANNETGVIHPVATAARLVKARGGYVFCDAVQALGRIPLDIGRLGVDFLAVSSHKLGGPQGVGALVLADEMLRPKPLITGGGQERRGRAGTENVAAIAAFGVAANLARHHLEGVERIADLRDRLEREFLAVSPEARIIGGLEERLPNTTMLAVPGLSAETLVIAFDLEGIAVSAGSACSSGKIAASHVLEAMGEAMLAQSGIRVSLPASVQPEDIDITIDAWRGIHARMTRSRAA